MIEITFTPTTLLGLAALFSIQLEYWPVVILACAFCLSIEKDADGTVPDFTLVVGDILSNNTIWSNNQSVDARRDVKADQSQDQDEEF